MIGPTGTRWWKLGPGHLRVNTPLHMITILLHHTLSSNNRSVQQLLLPSTLLHCPDYSNSGTSIFACYQIYGFPASKCYLNLEDERNWQRFFIKWCEAEIHLWSGTYWLQCSLLCLTSWLISSSYHRLYYMRNLYKNHVGNRIYFKVIRSPVLYGNYPAPISHWKLLSTID